MLRDTRRDVAYFNKWIDFSQNVINEVKQTIDSLSRPEGKAGCASDLFKYSIHNCIMLYGCWM
jgi:hypothetical protein